MSTTAAPVLRADRIVKAFGPVRALEGADFELFPGEIHALVGDNGAGKKACPGPRRTSSGWILIGSFRT